MSRLLGVLLALACALAYGEATSVLPGRLRIAYSADGNHNDPDEWIASPMTLAILAAVGLKDRLVPAARKLGTELRLRRVWSMEPSFSNANVSSAT